MNSPRLFQLLRIAALIAVIFASGIVIGRVTSSPAPPVSLAPTSDSRTFDQAGDIVERAVVWMKKRFDLTNAQEPDFRALMGKMEAEMMKHDPGSRERLEIYREFSPLIREFVPENLKSTYDANNRRHERRFRRAINQAESNGNEAAP